MGFLSFIKKPFKAIGKAFKKVGKFIKKKFQKLGKFMNKLGIVGQIGMMFLTAGAANMVMSGLTSVLQMGATSTGALGAISKGVLKAVSTVKKLGTGLKTAFKGTVGSVAKAVGNIVTPTMKAIGEKFGMNFANPVLQSKGGAGLLDTIGQGIVESAKYSKDQFASLKAQGKGFFANTVVDPVTGTTNISGDPKKYENILDINKLDADTLKDTRQSLLDLGGGTTRDANYVQGLQSATQADQSFLRTGIKEASNIDKSFLRTGIEDATNIDKDFLRTGIDINYNKDVSEAGKKFLRGNKSLLSVPNVPEVTKRTLASSAQAMTDKMYDYVTDKDNLLDATTAAVGTSISGLMTQPVETEGGGQRFMGDSLNIGMEALATGGVTAPLQTAAFNYFNLENNNNRQANYFGTVG